MHQVFEPDKMDGISMDTILTAVANPSFDPKTIESVSLQTFENFCVPADGEQHMMDNKAITNGFLGSQKNILSKKTQNTKPFDGRSNVLIHFLTNDPNTSPSSPVPNVSFTIAFKSDNVQHLYFVPLTTINFAIHLFWIC